MAVTAKTTSTLTCTRARDLSRGHVVDIRFGKTALGGPLRRPLRRLPTASSLHHIDRRADVTVHPEKPFSSSQAPRRPGMAGRLHRHPAKVERKIAHYVRVLGWRKAASGQERVATDVDTAPPRSCSKSFRPEHFVGVRNLIHVRPDADWVLSATVDTSLGCWNMPRSRSTLSLCSPALEHVAVLCERTRAADCDRPSVKPQSAAPT